MPVQKVKEDQENPIISVIICTFNRMDLLKLNLQSLANQTIDKTDFEVILIDDGSTDDTKNIVKSFTELIPIRYYFQQNSGPGSARNHGIFAARGRFLFFFDDDDIAAPTLLEEHLKTHKQYPDKNFAVLNYTTWHPDINVSPLMYYITMVGCHLFSYPSIIHDMILDYTYFWTGRLSCKRSFLLYNGVFRSDLEAYEDIELGYRLFKKGELKIAYNEKAVSYMTRKVSFDNFCQRLVKQGRSLYLLNKIHNCPEIDQYCKLKGAEKDWESIAPFYTSEVRAARELDRIVTSRAGLGLEVDRDVLRLLYASYSWVFKACKLQGMNS
ncbi:MAG: glycosyltransferase family 2 protein [Clostridiales bacterium]|nr:glycosyltransferase family 2 protein [Clostridiales bacterium]MCF8022842.1 glycosyltransferase family 2 protein [Clostridiales bacterium]